MPRAFHHGALRIMVLWLFGACLPLGLQAWDWKLSTDKFQEMNVFQRTQYQKAEKLFNDGNFKLAGIEFEKFINEFEDSPALPAAVFMEALCEQKDLRRTTAIKSYQHLLDFWPGDTNYAPAAQYYIGLAYIENGDITKGLKEMDKMVANAAYKVHPLAADALNQLAENAKKNNDFPNWTKYKQQIYADFYDKNRTLADQSRDDLVRYYVRTENYTKLEQVVALHNWAKPTESPDYYWYLWERACNDVLQNWYTPALSKERVADAAAFWAYWQKGQGVAQKANAWEYDRRSLEFLLRFQGQDKATWEKLANDLGGPKSNDGAVRHVIGLLVSTGHLDVAMPLTANIKDKQAFYPWFFNELAARNLLDQAEHVLALIDDPSERLWRTYELRRQQGRWKDCVEALKKLADTDQKRAPQANRTLVWVYKDATRQYPEAIKLCNEINEQPWSNFEIGEIEGRQNHMKESAAAYAEIENFFPDHAGEAAWRRGNMYQTLGNTEKAIAEYMRILKVYKDKPQAAAAHQRLREMGVKTGGGELKE